MLSQVPPLDDDRWLRRLTRSLTGHPGEADDVLQETRLAWLRGPPADLRCPQSWLARVAVNFARRRRRDDTRRRSREAVAARSEVCFSRADDPIERGELQRALRQAVAGLREPYRSTVMLRFFEEMSLAGIAAAHGAPVPTVKTRLSRALAMLRAALDRGGKGRPAWTAAIIPGPGPGVRAAAGKAGAAGGRAATIFPIPHGVSLMSLKTVLGAAALSAVVFLGGTALILRGRERPQAAASPSAAQTRPVLAPGRDDVAPAPAVDAALEPLASGLTAAAPPASAAAEASSAGAGPVEVADADADAEESPRAVASAAAMEVRQAFQELKRRFGDGGGEGWRGVRDGIARMQELILGSEEGFLELLALVDAEEGGEGGSFLEALMHHLPLGGGELRERIVEHAELAGELWARYEAEESAGKRAALMRFFVFNRRLSASRMGEFVKLATDEPARSVRQLSIDALASNRELIEDTWQTLARVYDQDTDIECRETAIHGLAHARADEAAARIRAAFGSPDERIRAAALDSAAGEQLPGEVSGGDGPAYLVRELRAARSRRYKQALIGRLLESAPGLLESEIHGALAGEKDWGVQKDFREALKKIEAMREERRG